MASDWRQPHIPSVFQRTGACKLRQLAHTAAKRQTASPCVAGLLWLARQLLHRTGYMLATR